MNETFGLGLNARRIVADLRREGPMSRADLARLLDITPSTVTRITGQMIADGLLSEMPDPNRLGRKGYPARLLDLMAQDKKVLDGKLRFIMARGIGAAFVTSDVPADVVRGLLAEELARR